jgi:hypothetical protein
MAVQKFHKVPKRKRRALIRSERTMNGFRIDDRLEVIANLGIRAIIYSCPPGDYADVLDNLVEAIKTGVARNSGGGTGNTVH